LKVIHEGTTQEQTESNTERAVPDSPLSVSLQKVPPSDLEDHGSNPVEVYKQITGNTCPIYFQDLIRNGVGDEPESVALWGAVCEVWRDTEQWNDRQVRKMLNDFQKQLSESKKNGGPNGETRTEAFRRFVSS